MYSLLRQRYGEDSTSFGALVGKIEPLRSLASFLLVQSPTTVLRRFSSQASNLRSRPMRVMRPICRDGDPESVARPAVGEQLMDTAGIRDARVQDESGSSVSLRDVLPKSSRGDANGVVVFLRHLG